MTRIIQISMLVMVLPIVAGLNCTGTTPTDQPNGDPSGDPQPLDPSLLISAVGVIGANDTLIVNGTFGDEPGVVTINGITLHVVDWGPAGVITQQIICDLPQEAYGNIQVQVGARYSNVVQLTKWELTIVSKTHVPVSPSSGSTGEQNYDIYTTFVIRACLNNPLGTAEPFSQGASVSRASTGVFDAYGTVTNPGSAGQPDEVFTLSKAPYELTIVYPGNSTDVKFAATPLGSTAVRGSGGGIALAYTVEGTYISTRMFGVDVTISEPIRGYASSVYFPDAGEVQFPFDGGFNIVAGSVPDVGDPNSTLEWQAAAASAPPVD